MPELNGRMPQFDTRSRRSFLVGVFSTSILTAAALYAKPGGRPTASISLSLWTGTDSTGGRQLLFDMWNKANPDVQLRAELDTGRTGDQKQRMKAAATSGEADILNLDIIDIPEFAAENLISPITLNGKLFLDKVLRPGRIADKEDQFWAAPFNTDVGLLFERVPAGATALERPDLRQIIDRLVPAGSRGFVAQTGPGSSASAEAFTINVLEHVMSRDPDLLRDDLDLSDRRLPLYEAARWYEALSPLWDAIAEGRLHSADNELNSVEAFMNASRPRFMRNWPVAYRDLLQKNDPDTRQGRVKVHAFPTAVLGGQSLAVAANSSRKDEAIKVIEFLTGDEAQKVLAERGLAPTKVAAYTDPQLLVSVPHLETIRQAVEGARSRPAHPNYSVFTSAVAAHIRPFLHSVNKGPLPSAFTDAIRTAFVG